MGWACMALNQLSKLSSEDVRGVSASATQDVSVGMYVYVLVKHDTAVVGCQPSTAISGKP